MACEYGKNDCEYEGTDKCIVCVDSFHFMKKKIKNKYPTKRIKTKETKRQGAISEVKSFNQMDEAFNTNVTGTPNSGAGRIKGDEQIRGIINVMTELKTTTKKNEGRQPGKESFSIKREWLEKLDREAKAEEMEFFYLKFSFKESDDKFYAVTDVDLLIDMIVTMKEDRIKARTAQNKINIAEKQTSLIKAENIKLLSEIDYLKAKIKDLEDANKNTI